ncbi:MAG: matrixin family metalloprotease [Candidatus Pacearchaeota archaeon]
MGWKIFFSFLFILFALLLLVLYWFIPIGDVAFKVKSTNSNFSLNGSENLQFYSNMRFPDANISYRLLSCPLQKENDMENAFEIVSNKTLLNFYSVNSNEEIFVTCDSTTKFDDGLFIAGEGGPTNITKTNNFNVILNGKILLLKESNCERPNVAIHELFHVLGFKHSNNPENIMYNFSRCEQTIGDDNIVILNKLYSVPSYSDLGFENVSASMHGRYLDINISIRNNGLKKSEEAKIIIYADGKNIKEIDLRAVDIGYGITISLTNVFINKLNVNEIELIINSDFNELDIENNKIILEIRQ